MLPLATYQFTLRSPIGGKEKNEVGLIGAVGAPGGITGGAYFRHAVLGTSPDSRAVVSAQASGGLAWIGVALPAAFKLSDQTWLTTQPGIRTTVFPILHLPIGMSFDVGNGKRIDTEVGAHFSTKDHRRSIFRDSYAAYAGISFAHELGQRELQSKAEK